MIYKFNYIKIKILGYQKTLRNITTCRKLAKQYAISIPKSGKPNTIKKTKNYL